MSESPFDQKFLGIARRIGAMGVKPHHLTFAQIPVFVLMLRAAVAGESWEFFAWSWLPVLLDGGDGILARAMGTSSKAGAKLDATMDTIGILAVMMGALLLAPSFWPWLWAIFILNVLLYAQNRFLDEKVVTYARGPIIVGATIPVLMPVAIAMVFTISVLLLLLRLPARRFLEPPSPST